MIFTCLFVFAILLIANVYFRIKSFRTFKKLADGGVGFNRAHFLDKEKLKNEVLARFPQHEKLIVQHIKSMKVSMSISAVCVFVLTVCGAVLMYYR